MLHLQAKRLLCKQVSCKAKKQAAVLAASMSVIEKKEELEWVPCIYYLVTFKDQTKALWDLKSEINTINQAFAHQLGLTI